MNNNFIHCKIPVLWPKKLFKKIGFYTSILIIQILPSCLLRKNNTALPSRSIFAMLSVIIFDNPLLEGFNSSFTILYLNPFRFLMIVFSDKLTNEQVLPLLLRIVREFLTL